MTETVENGFLGGRLSLLQPRHGYRAATDPVLLAASALTRSGAKILDLGCGVGTAALCLGWRVAGLDLHGLEIQPDYAELARRNAERNGLDMTVHTGDIRSMPSDLRHRQFDAVIMNPPWHSADDLGSPDAGKDRANRMQDLTLTLWITAAMTRCKPGGWISIIQRAEWLPEVLAGLGPRCGDVAVLPLQARAGRDAKRMIVKARKGSHGPFRLAAPLVMHDGPAHVQDGDDYSPLARAILRDGAALDF